jgi:polyribonucleotide 5'-hydroxyl-kinase
MSIPGLGQIPSQVHPQTCSLSKSNPSQPATSATRTIALRPAWEWRFTVPNGGSLTVKLQNGTAEKDGIELAPRNLYTFTNVRTKITTWHGCEIEVEGQTAEESVAEYAGLAENPGNALLNLHAKLNGLRDAAGRDGREGPRVLITGEGSAGKTTVARTLVSYATRQAYQPLVVNMDPAEGMFALRFWILRRLMVGAVRLPADRAPCL